MSDRKKVDVFYVGCMRSGSTWLYDALKSTKLISLHKNKESYFFDRNYDSKNITEYESCFPDFESLEFRVDISPTYTEDPGSLERIYLYNKNAKFIFIFREHYDLVLSQYKYLLANGVDPGSFERYWENLDKTKFLFSKYMRNLIKFYGSENILILDFKQSMSDKKKYVKSVLEFIGVEGFDLSDINLNKRINTSDFYPANKSIYAALRNMGGWLAPFVGISIIRRIRKYLDIVLRKKITLDVDVSDESRIKIKSYYESDRINMVDLLNG